MHLSGLIIRTGHEKENSQTSKNIHKKKIDLIYQFSLRKHSAKAVSSGFFQLERKVAVTMKVLKRLVMSGREWGRVSFRIGMERHSGLKGNKNAQN